MRADELFEGTDLARLRIECGIDHDVGDVGEAAGAQYVARGVRAEREQRVGAVDASRLEVVDAVGSDREWSIMLRHDEDEADAFVLDEPGDQVREGRVDLLQRASPRFGIEVDQAEAA